MIDPDRQIDFKIPSEPSSPTTTFTIDICLLEVSSVWSCFHDSFDPSRYAARNFVVCNKTVIMLRILFKHGSLRTMSWPWKKDNSIAKMLAWMEVGGHRLASSSKISLSHSTIHSMCPPLLSWFFTHCFANIAGVIEYILSFWLQIMALYCSSCCSNFLIQCCWSTNSSFTLDNWRHFNDERMLIWLI